MRHDGGDELVVHQQSCRKVQLDDSADPFAAVSSRDVDDGATMAHQAIRNDSKPGRTDFHQAVAATVATKIKKHNPGGVGVTFAAGVTHGT